MHIIIYTYIETVERKRKVYLDYRSDPTDLDIEKLSSEAADYLKRSQALGSTPLERLKKLNAPAINLYKVNNMQVCPIILLGNQDFDGSNKT